MGPTDRGVFCGAGAGGGVGASGGDIYEQMNWDREEDWRSAKACTITAWPAMVQNHCPGFISPRSISCWLSQAKGLELWQWNDWIANLDPALVRSALAVRKLTTAVVTLWCQGQAQVLYSASEKVKSGRKLRPGLAVNRAIRSILRRGAGLCSSNRQRNPPKKSSWRARLVGVGGVGSAQGVIAGAVETGLIQRHHIGEKVQVGGVKVDDIAEHGIAALFGLKRQHLADIAGRAEWVEPVFAIGAVIWPDPRRGLDQPVDRRDHRGLCHGVKADAVDFGGKVSGNCDAVSGQKQHLRKTGVKVMAQGGRASTAASARIRATGPLAKACLPSCRKWSSAGKCVGVPGSGRRGSTGQADR